MKNKLLKNKELDFIRILFQVKIRITKLKIAYLY